MLTVGAQYHAPSGLTAEKAPQVAVTQEDETDAEVLGLCGGKILLLKVLELRTLVSKAGISSLYRLSYHASCMSIASFC
jgi:hypothetical protein